MNLVLDITTSAVFWRRIYPADRAPLLDGFATPQRCAQTRADVDALAPSWATPEFLAPIGGKLHVLSMTTGARGQSSRHVVHAWGGPLPDGSFYDLGNDALVASPPFMFLAAASTLTFEKLVAFGCELCGRYSFDESQERGFRNRSIPLTTASRLEQYLAGAKNCRGHSKAAAALPHVLENSASPMETFDALCMCLPYRHGGYCLPKPSMNHEIGLSPRAAHIARRKKCYLDMGYPGKSLDIEHHGKLDHSNDTERASDRARVNALKEMGLEVIELTNDQVDDIMAFEYIIQRIAKLLGKRLRKENLGVTNGRMKLHKELREWNRSAGRLR